jgi:nitrite reductase/ring-hydroxylating ferredoxin subunit
LAEQLCRILEIPDGGAREVKTGSENPLSVILIRRQEQVYAYENSCPHALMAFNWEPNQFLFSPAGKLVCPQHGAGFIVETGECVLGPCLGAYLERFKIKLKDGAVWVA